MRNNPNNPFREFVFYMSSVFLVIIHAVLFSRLFLWSLAFLTLICVNLYYRRELYGLKF